VEQADQPLVAIAADGQGADGPARLCGLTEASLQGVVAVTLARAGIRRPVELSVLVTDDEALRRLNRTYRGRDETTDVLSFPLLDTPLALAPADQLWGLPAPVAPARRDFAPASSVVTYDEESMDSTADGDAKPFAFIAPTELPLHLGDIVVARQTAERQALKAAHSAAWELAYLVAHGVLHLAGYDDHTEAGYATMVAHQEAALQESGIAR
jgi:probable rRNA maturation factor